jgi:uncharacterized RDD family membrane protein YckC
MPYAGGYGMPGVPVGPGGAPLANYGQRLAGWLIDFVLLLVVTAVILLPIHAVRRVDTVRNTTTFHTNGVGIVIPAIIVILYGMFMCGSARGQTLGMMIAKTRVVDANTGGPIGPARALGRAAFEYVLAIVIFIPWVVDMLFPLWDQRNQTLHDKVTNSVVVRVS